MKYFIVQGILKDTEKMTDDIMKEHMVYTKKAMDSGDILMSGLKSDMSGGLFIIKSESLEKLQAYLSNEPFYVYKLQDYVVTEFTPHYCNKSPEEWFQQ